MVFSRCDPAVDRSRWAIAVDRGRGQSVKNVGIQDLTPSNREARMFVRWFAPALVFALAAAYPSAQDTAERIDTEVNARIRMEGINRSQIMRTMHYLTDVYGPRLTGSPNHENAAKWAIEQLTAWGLAN